MTAVRRILRVGLTGGIASGKSTVSGIMADLGAFVIDADVVAHELMAPGGLAYDGVVDRFGDEILDGQGRIVRERLAQKAFNDRSGLDDLNRIVHPKLRFETDRRITDCEQHGRSPIAVFDAALLVETGAYKHFDRLVVVSCSPETQLKRLMERSGMSPDQAGMRIRAQAALADKLALADYVIETEGSLDATRQATREVYTALLADAAAAAQSNEG